jgi:hypothetical protein
MTINSLRPPKLSAIAFNLGVLSAFVLAMGAAVVGWTDPAKNPSINTPNTVLPSNQKTGSLSSTPTSKATTKNRPPLAGMVPVKTFNVNPPASFTGNQLPQDGATEFLIQGKAGQVLYVKQNEVGVEILVQSPSAGSPRLTPGGDYHGNQLFALPQTGTYRVLARPAIPETRIRFELLTIDNPLIDPGIRPDQVLIDFDSFARRDQLTVVPYADWEGDEGDAWPSHLAAVDAHFEFRIMSIAAYRKRFPSDRRLASLQAALQSPSTSFKAENLPYSRRDSWCGQVMTARQKMLQGEGWSGLRWIGGFGGDENYPSCGLGYVFNGISNDGRFLIILRADIAQPDQKHLLPTSRASGTQMRAQLEKRLDAADPVSFDPNLDKLDAVIRSLRFNQ